MYIVSKDKNSIVNLEQITNIYIGADGCTIKVDFVNGKGCQIARYSSESASQTAIEMVARNIGKMEICFMPEDSAVNAKINHKENKQHYISGKKAKGHGGS